ALVCWGDNSLGACDVPPLPSGEVWVQVACGFDYTVGLTSLGRVLGWGFDWSYNLPVPARKLYGPGLFGPPYEDVSIAGHAMLVTGKGELVAFGSNDYGQMNVPPVPAGVRYERAFCGFLHTTALRSDGEVVAFGDNSRGQCSIPILPTGIRYTDV